MYLLVVGDYDSDFNRIQEVCLEKGHEVVFSSAVGYDDTKLKKTIIRTDGLIYTSRAIADRSLELESYLKEHDISSYVFPDIPEMHPTEVRSPIQVNGFIEMVMDMLHLHEKKNLDYSPANILATGELGLVTRLWDKVARLLSLSGFKISISGSEFTSPSQPKNESIDDTYLDLANYGIIGRLLRAGKWGK